MMNRMQHVYRMIALDMDGTVLNSNKEIDSQTAQMIHLALQKGKEVVFCTGRSLSEMRLILEDFPDMHYLIGESGGFVYDLKERRILSCVCMPPGLLETICDAVQGRDVMLNMMCSGEYYLDRRQAQSFAKYQMGEYQATLPLAGHQVGGIREEIRLHPDGAEKFNIFHTSTEERMITRKALEKCALDIEMVDSEVSSLECTPRGIGKGAGLRCLAAVTGISTDDMIMVGDADNDMDALRTAGLAIAMGNANEHVKSFCPVTVSDNDHAGCAEAIRDYLLA